MPTALIAFLAAMAATLGDFLLLFVGKSLSPEFLLPTVPEAFLWVGAILGVVGIPLYGLGYHAASRIVETYSKGASRAVFMFGGLGALIGAIIHACTAFRIHSRLEADAAAAQGPFSSGVGWDPTILVLWMLAGTLIILASVFFGWFVARRGDSSLHVLALANPALVTVALVGAGMSTPLFRSFLVPAAPNIAHVVFFGACVWAHRAGRLTKR